MEILFWLVLLSEARSTESTLLLHTQYLNLFVNHFRGMHFQNFFSKKLSHMAAIVLRPFSGNFTRFESHAVKNSEEVLSYFFHLHSINN
jgi:hypothetical protein